MTESLQPTFINVHTHHSQNSDQIIELINIFSDEVTEEKLNKGFCSIGIHPWHVHQNTYAEQLKKIKQFITHPNVKAIGEIGLDKTSSVPFELQTTCFLDQIAIATEHNKPIIVHCVRAFNELMHHRQKSNPKVPWVIHGYRGKEILMLQLIEEGCYISFGSDLIRIDSHCLENIKFVSLENIFFETDDSDHTIESIYKAAARIRQQDIGIIKSSIEKNFKNIFN